jgi:hypothetical protein
VQKTLLHFGATVSNASTVLCKLDTALWSCEITAVTSTPFTVADDALNEPATPSSTILFALVPSPMLTLPRTLRDDDDETFHDDEAELPTVNE